MSLDAEYILDYFSQECIDPKPWDIDKKYLEETHGGHVVKVAYDVFYYEKPKHRLLPEDIKQLNADRVLEKIDCDLFEIIK